jgi:hypothetical protein
MRFIGAFDVIFRLVVAWELLYHFENISWRKTLDRLQGNEIPNLESMGRHRLVAFPGRITASHHLNSVEVILTGAHSAERPAAQAPIRFAPFTSNLRRLTRD